MFESVIKHLIQGEFICEVSDESAFHFLQDNDQLQAIDAFLNRLGYRLAMTQNELAYYVAFQHIDHPARSDIRKIFQQFRIELYPVVEWLDMMMACLNQDTALAAGDTLSFASLLQVIEHNQALADRLLSFAKFKDFAGSDDSVKARLEKY